MKAWPGIVLALLLAGCAKNGDAPDKAPEPQVEVRAAGIEERTFQDAITAPGAWKSAGEVSLRAPAAGVVLTLGPHPGDAVALGSAVGTLETRESRAAVEGALALAREAHGERAQADAARAVELARREVVRVPLKAPIAGVVLDRLVQPGATVDDGGEILTLAPRGGRVFEAHVPAAQVARIRPGQAAEIGATIARAARVRTVLPEIDSTEQAALVWLSPVTAGFDAPIGRFETARILVGAPRRALAVPDSAIVEDDVTGEKRVAVVGPDGRAAWTVITPGADEDGWTELTAPALPATTRVVVQGQRGLPDHARLTIVK